MKTCQPSSVRARPLAMATTTLNRTVVVVSSPLDASTMKVTAIPRLRHARRRARASSVPAFSNQREDFEPASMDNPFRKSSRPRFPASSAALYDRKPLSHNLTPMGRLLRRISQHQESLPFRETMTKNDLRGEGRSMRNRNPVHLAPVDLSR